MSSKPHKKAEEGKAVAVLPEAQLPVGMTQEDLLADAGQGSENVTMTDMAIPIISILQANSPQCKRSDPGYVEGAHEGLLWNNVTSSLEGDEEHGITVVPAHYEKVFIEWKPNRGGFAGMHPANTPLKDKVKMTEVTEKDGSKKLVPLLPNGNALIETDQHYVLVLKPNGGFSGAVIAMSSTALKSSRLWNTLVDQVRIPGPNGAPFNPARFYMKYKVTTKGKVKGTYSWATWAIEPAGVNTEAYQAAKALRDAVKGGMIRVKQEQTDDDEAGTTGTSKAKEDDIPLDI